MAHNGICLNPGAHRSRRRRNGLATLNTLTPRLQNLVWVVPRLFDAVVAIREVVRIRHSANRIANIRDSRPILTVCSCIARVCSLAKDIHRHISTYGVNLVARILHKSLNSLHLRLVVLVVVVDKLLHLGHTVGETNIVEVDLVEAELTHRLLCQLHIELPYLAVVWAWPIGLIVLEWLARSLLGDCHLWVVLHKVRILEAGDTTYHIEALLVQTLYRILIHRLLVLTGIAIVCWRVLLHSLRLVAGALVVLNIYYKGINLGLLCKVDILLDIADNRRRDIQIERVASLGHLVVCKLNTLGRVEVATEGLATTE